MQRRRHDSPWPSASSGLCVAYGPELPNAFGVLPTAVPHRRVRAVKDPGRPPGRLVERRAAVVALLVLGLALDKGY